MIGFDRESDSSILGFCIDCEIMGAIKFDEFKDYLYQLIQMNDINEIPSFIWELLDLPFEERASIYNIIGFVPNSHLTADEENAIYGVAIKRFTEVYDIPVSKEQALEALNKNPHILDMFKEIFPFIELGF